jgi:choline dehydrogenase-like flavoprotein
MSIKWILAIGVGLAGGWAARSLADSPQGAGVKLLEIGLKTKERVGRWAALEAERLDDMLAEARSTAEPNVSRSNGATNKSRAKGQSGNGRRRTRPVKRAEQA